MDDTPRAAQWFQPADDDPTPNSKKVSSETLTNFTRTAQAEQFWCWAACVQMVWSAVGINKTQESIVTNQYGSVLNRPGPVAPYLDRTFTQGDRSVTLTCDIVNGSPTTEAVKTQINRYRLPFVLSVAVPGGSHAVVVYGYEEYANRDVILLIHDPGPHKDKRWSLFRDNIREAYLPRKDSAPGRPQIVNALSSPSNRDIPDRRSQDDVESRLAQLLARAALPAEPQAIYHSFPAQTDVNQYVLLAQPQLTQYALQSQATISYSIRRQPQVTSYSYSVSYGSQADVSSYSVHYEYHYQLSP